MNEKSRYRIVSTVSILISILGIPFAAFVTGNSADGGRGGAVGASIALLFLFINRDYGARLYTALMQDLPELKARLELEKAAVPAPNAEQVPIEKRVDQLDMTVSTLVRRLNIEAEGQRTQSIFLAIATAIGTVAWGFGDLVAKILIVRFPYHFF